MVRVISKPACWKKSTMPSGTTVILSSVGETSLLHLLYVVDYGHIKCVLLGGLLSSLRGRRWKGKGKRD